MRTLSQRITEDLRERILSGALTAGDRLEEIPLAEQLGVSRTPVRGALSALANQGLLDYQPKRGYVVRAFDAEEIFAAYEVRASLEGLACRLAAERGLPQEQLDELRRQLRIGDQILAKGRLDLNDFEPYQAMNVILHETILAASKNAWIARFAAQAQEIPYVSQRVILWHDHATILRSHDDHHRIVTAIDERKPTRAEDLMREHVYYAGLFLRDNFHRRKKHGAAAKEFANARASL